MKTIKNNQQIKNLQWKALEKNTICKTVVLDVTQQKSQSPEGDIGTYIVMDAPDWVTVIPVIEDDFLMVKQWRHGAQELSIEFPGGVIDKGESPDKAARRELQEETGYKTNHLEYLGSINPNPAIFSNHFHVFCATELENTLEQHLDNDEFVTFERIKIEEVIEKMGKPPYIHALMATALQYYCQKHMN